MTNTKEIIQKSITDSFSSSEYSNMMQDYAKEGKTTGEQKEDLIYYTKLNAQRSKRIGKTVKLKDDLVNQISSIQEKQNWILITESWCGDAANGVPVLSAISELNDNIDLRMVLRDTNPELMDKFLTNGGKSIPKLIVTDDQFEVLFTWGPRPKTAQELYDGWRKDENKIPYKEFQVELQKWYNEDGGQSMQDEMLELLSR
ncbi:MAG: thioredoxin family protein [Ekhidna sp.]